MNEDTAAVIAAPEPEPEHVRAVRHAARNRLGVLYTPAVIGRAAALLGSMLTAAAAHGVEPDPARRPDMPGVALDLFVASLRRPLEAGEPGQLLRRVAERVELAGEQLAYPTIAGSWGARIIVERSCSTPRWGVRGDGDLWIGLQRYGSTWGWMLAPDVQMTDAVFIAAELTSAGAEEVADIALQILTGQAGDPFSGHRRFLHNIPAQRAN